METIRIAILGAKFIANFKIQVYKRIPGVEIVSIMGKDRHQTREVASQNGIPYVGTTFEEILEGPEFDAVDICLPNYLHRDYSIKAARAGKHIICEKPLGRTALEAQEMLDEAEKAGIIHFYGENWIFSPDMREIEDILKQGIIGRPLWMRGREAHFGPHSEWFYDKKQSGGGALLDMGCHVIGAFNKFLNLQAEEVFCYMSTLFHKTDCEDNAIALIKYPNGLIGQVEASWTTRGGMSVSFEVWGDEGMILYDRSGVSQPIKVFTSRKTDKYFMEKAELNRGWLFPMVEEYRKYGYYDEITHFVDCIRKKEKPILTFKEGLEVNKIIDKAYVSSQTRKWERV